MSKYQRVCSCVVCKTTTTVQSLKAHLRWHEKILNSPCVVCGAPTSNLKFCGHSCAASHNNTKRSRKQAVKENKTELIKQRRFKRFIDGEVTERSALRKYLAETRGYKCVICNVSEWNNQPLMLIVDRINGNAGDNKPENLRLLCPNCNTQTDTFGGRNKGNGRKARGLSLA